MHFIQTDQNHAVEAEHIVVRAVVQFHVVVDHEVAVAVEAVAEVIEIAAEKVSSFTRK